MILYLRRKMGLMGRDENGQSMVFIALTLFMMFLFVCVTVNVGDFVAQKVDAQNSADAMAISLAAWQARGLNQIQTLNMAKNLAHVYYMGEVAEVIYWIAQYIAALATWWNPFDDIWALWNLRQAAGGPICWITGWCPEESLPDEYVEFHDELDSLTEIQSFIAGVDLDGDEAGRWGSVEAAMMAAIPMIESANGGGAASMAANAAVARWELGGLPNIGLGLYDPDLKIDFVLRDTMLFMIFNILQIIGIDIDSGDLGDIGDFLNQLSTVLEVPFDWAIQTDDFLTDQFTVGLAVRDATSPMFGGRFKPKTLIGTIFGNLGGGGEVQLAIAQARPFKPQPYVLRPGNNRNGMAANLFGLPIDLRWIIGQPPSASNAATWDVKLTPVTVISDLGLGGVSDLVMTH